MPDRYVAQINIARFRTDKDDPANAEFMAALDDVNAAAEGSPGFVWRLVGDGNDATDVEVVPGDPRLIVNMSVWRDVASLEAFAYRHTGHRAVLSRRKEWFEAMEPAFALWWIDAGHQPTVAEGVSALEELRRAGPGDRVFTFGSAKS